MSIEISVNRLIEECEIEMKEYETIGLSRIDHSSLINRVKLLKKVDSKITKLFEYSFFHTDCVDKKLLGRNYIWLSNQYKIIAAQLVGVPPVVKSEIYRADGIDDRELKQIKKLWPENKYHHGPNKPDLIFKVRSEYMSNMANALGMNLMDEIF